MNRPAPPELGDFDGWQKSRGRLLGHAYAFSTPNHQRLPSIMQMTFSDDDLDRLSDRLAEQVHAKLPDWRPLVSDPEQGEILGIDPHCLYSVQFLADRWEVSTDTIYRKSSEELPRAEWKGTGIRYRGVDILRYEGIDLDSDEESASRDDERPHEPDRPPHSSPSESESAESNYNGKLPEL